MFPSSSIACAARSFTRRPRLPSFPQFPLKRFQSTIPTATQYTHQLDFISDHPTIPVYRLLDNEGRLVDPQLPVLDKDLCVNIYKQMTLLNQMDMIMFDAQRQGRISFYMTNYGEEATHFGTASALHPDDIVYGQYREAGVLMYRGFTLDQFMNQCYSNSLDLGKGRQMPVHYGTKELNFHTISSPLGTQLPQASGAAYALKRSGKQNCVVCYFGEGAASEGDFHYALNFAATLGCPVIFLCRNNGYAISTPAKEQYAGDGIASRGWGYGVKSIRVDGNDVFAMHYATKLAREYSIREHKPVLLEAMTYRVGHHSTSDDSSAYRSKKEAEEHNRRDNPITRLRLYLERTHSLPKDYDTQLKQECRKQVLEAFSRAEKVVKPSVKEMFEDVYDLKTRALEEQERELNEILAKYPQEYPLKEFKQD